ncbi:hypothetical protein [Bifidobacterium sp. SO4]|uniref:hypothetical protein n=1 Tax=Bifidobacterium sp. SO4 TaxID=2809030 RepID=UPI001BDD6D26|nr:hypothetical protein [Bifidobacterium sp. SO4]MBT1171744.1 hypothetical protein [Bifidobacterium sp. SO4]
MKKAKPITTMKIYQREEPAIQTRDIMDNQDNYKRGDGEEKSVGKVMTTFQMDKELKEQLKAYCKDRGLKMGDFINNAIKQALE